MLSGGLARGIEELVGIYVQQPVTTSRPRQLHRIGGVQDLPRHHLGLDETRPHFVPGGQGLPGFLQLGVVADRSDAVIARPPAPRPGSLGSSKNR